VRQRTQIINAIRGHLAEYGHVAPKGVCYVERLIDQIDSLPDAAQTALRGLVQTLRALDEQMAELDREIARRARKDETARRLMTIPGIGPVTAAALAALAPDPQTFRCGRDFSAWLGLTPLQKSTGGKQKLGQITKMGERTLRRLLVIGASAVIKQALLRGAPAGSWLAQMLASKPRMLVAVALANKTARIVWALMARGGIYRAPALAA
jgi:transposase